MNLQDQNFNSDLKNYHSYIEIKLKHAVEQPLYLQLR